jgi:two-component system nitrate/nitrite response regulator NarL
MSADEQPLRILIADADAFFRRGIREILNEAAGINVVGEAVDAEQAVRIAHDLQPHGLDLVLLDVELARGNNFAPAERLITENPDLAVVILTAAEVESDVLDVVRAGAVGYLSKTQTPAVLVRALHGFHRAESLPISRPMALALLARLRERVLAPQVTDEPLPNLTAREKEVCQMIAHGARDREIAAQLVVSESTVKKHVQNILRKLHARNRAEAVARLGQSMPSP